MSSYSGFGKRDSLEKSLPVDYGQTTALDGDIDRDFLVGIGD